MTTGPVGPAASTESYSPERRTALLFTGTGTAGAYHAGVLRALAEAGVKIDVVAGRGIGAIGALYAAIDGGQRLWGDQGLWRRPESKAFYPWRLGLRLAVWALWAALAFIAVPLVVMAFGLVVFPIDFVLKMVGIGAGGGLVGAYVALAQQMFAPTALPTWLPRLVVLALGAAGVGVAALGWLGGDNRRRRGGFGWRLVRAPLVATPVVEACWASLWDLLRGAARVSQPDRAELARRYIELLTENLGQPGFRELLIAVHDVDTHRDLLFVLAAESRRAGLVRRPSTAETEARRAEVIDLASGSRDYLVDAIAAALAVPLVTDLHTAAFRPDEYWRGESHHLCDRPSCVLRLLEELAGLDVEQVVLVSAVAEIPGPHALAAARIDGRGRIGEYFQSFEASVVRDAVCAPSPPLPRVFLVRPVHNPLGPFDFAGGFDDRSDRPLPLEELIGRGYEDAHHQFINLVVGASGEWIGRAMSDG
jgi:hypothetical protein